MSNKFKMPRPGLMPSLGGNYRIERKQVSLPDGRSMEFDVKVCRPQRSVEQQVYSLCHARMTGCAHNTPRHTS